MTTTTSIEQSYRIASERYATLGVETEQALARLAAVPLSLQCWQGDDVSGFEPHAGAVSSGGIQATGGYPGRARTLEELRADLDRALSLLPGKHRVNIHAIYGDFGGRHVERDAIDINHFASWVDWARARGVGLDFNATCFAHPKAESGLTLSHPDPSVHDFWIEHVQRCREIAAEFGRRLGTPAVHNLWIPDGSKDITPARSRLRTTLRESLDTIYRRRPDPAAMRDAVECKLFGIGSEFAVVGSHEFYMGYAQANGLLLCIDMGHFHPTESVADKLSSLLLFFPELLFHVSRGMRWDSDHVVILNDELRSLAEELVRCDALGRVHLALDYFDASINRVGAWVIGARATQKALLAALLEPTATIQHYDIDGNHFARLALLEELKSMPFGAVWDYHCLRHGVPAGTEWIDAVNQYERDVLRLR
jgi:L-rhamnose isomerase